MFALIKNIKEVFKQGGVLFLFFCVLTLTCFAYLHEYFVCLFCVALLLIINTKKLFDSTGLLLLVFGLVHNLFMIVMGNSGSFVVSIENTMSPVMFYLYGKELVRLYGKESKLLYVLLIIIVFFLFITFYNVLADVVLVGVVNVNRFLGESEGEWVKSTILGLISSIGMIGIPVFASIKKPMRSPLAIMYFIVTILSIITGVHLVNRSGIVVFVICLGLCIMYISSTNKKNLFLLFVLLLIAYVYIMNQTYFGDVLSAYEARNLSEFDTRSAGGRTVLWNNGLHYLFTQPFGWSNTMGYCHNLWLDVGRDTGILSFILVVVAFVKGHKPIFKLITIKNRPWICALLGLNICFFVSSFVEPVTHACPYYFYLYCLFFGLQSATWQYRNVIEWDMNPSLN